MATIKFTPLRGSDNLRHRVATDMVNAPPPAIEWVPGDRLSDPWIIASIIGAVLTVVAFTVGWTGYSELLELERDLGAQP